MENKNLAVSVFTNEEFGEVRTLVVNEEIWFSGEDVVNCLAYDTAKNSYSKYIKRHCDEEDYLLFKKCDLDLFGMNDSGRKGEYLIKESAIYSLIFGSKLKSAKKFKRWVTSEVLPTIRKHGAYISENADVEYVNNELRFSEKRTIKTFADCKSSEEAEKLYEDFKAYVDKEYKSDTNTRIARYKSVEKGLTRLHDDFAKNTRNIGHCYLILALREKVELDRTTLEKRVSGGIRAYLKKKLQSASQTTIQ